MNGRLPIRTLLVFAAMNSMNTTLGSAKYGVQEETAFLIKTTAVDQEQNRTTTRFLRTHPHRSSLQGVSDLVYRGSYPVTKLSIPQESNPFDVPIDVYVSTVF